MECRIARGHSFVYYGPSSAVTGSGRGIGHTVAVESALIGAIGQASDMAAKMGIVGHTRGVALNQQSSGIKANCRSPSAATLMASVLPEDARPELDDSGDRQRVADVVAWMCSAGFTASGQVFGVGSRVMLYGQNPPVFTFDKGGGDESPLQLSLRPHGGPLQRASELFQRPLPEFGLGQAAGVASLTADRKREDPMPALDGRVRRRVEGQ